MSGEHKVSDEMLGAFVDGQVDRAEWAGIAQAVEGDAALREEVCRLRATKEMVRHAPGGSRWWPRACSSRSRGGSATPSGAARPCSTPRRPTR